MEVSRFWFGFRKFFWRGWGLALADAGALALLAVNVAFYWSLEGIGAKLVSLIFAYLLLMWFAIQGYLFSFLVELDQSIRLAVRNALFLAIDNLGVTIGLTIINVLLFLVSVPPWAAALAPYWVEHAQIGTDADARGPQMLLVDAEDTRRWTVRQILADPAGDHDWGISVEVDLDASDEAGEAVVTVTAVDQL
jgi:signal transduction histidine kinase